MPDLARRKQSWARPLPTVITVCAQAPSMTVLNRPAAKTALKAKADFWGKTFIQTLRKKSCPGILHHFAAPGAAPFPGCVTGKTGTFFPQTKHRFGEEC